MLQKVIHVGITEHFVVKSQGSIGEVDLDRILAFQKRPLALQQPSLRVYRSQGKFHRFAVVGDSNEQCSIGTASSKRSNSAPGASDFRGTDQNRVLDRDDPAGRACFSPPPATEQCTC